MLHFPPITLSNSTDQENCQVNNSLLQDTRLGPQSYSTTAQQSKGDNHIKLKTQNFSGEEDFEDYLAQFEITTEING